MSTYEIEEGVYTRDWGKALQVHDVSRCKQYSAPKARCMQTTAKKRLLPVSNTYATDASGTLAALTDINKESCVLLGVKQNALDKF